MVSPACWQDRNGALSTMTTSFSITPGQVICGEDRKPGRRGSPRPGDPRLPGFQAGTFVGRASSPPRVAAHQPLRQVRELRLALPVVRDLPHPVEIAAVPAVV